MSHLRTVRSATVDNTPGCCEADRPPDVPGMVAGYPGSRIIRRDNEVSAAPLSGRLGTTYLDTGPAGDEPELHVTAGFYSHSKFIAFHHTMLVKQDYHSDVLLVAKAGRAPHASP